ncbi:hypothetical protein OUZ56_002978 [Daphnia magna]|uniref:Uncharacterized protein n=1 Tax=Daphnia magna TaxID=35525 RepID=A0ABR0A7N8_9CRUS|nr:hypothetical protein OUZ56_002978 [Daphnia magna]
MPRNDKTIWQTSSYPAQKRSKVGIQTLGEERDRQLYMNSNRKRRDMMSDLTDFVQPHKKEMSP